MSIVLNIKMMSLKGRITKRRLTTICRNTASTKVCVMGKSSENFSKKAIGKLSVIGKVLRKKKEFINDFILKKHGEKEFNNQRARIHVKSVFRKKVLHFVVMQ